MTEDTLDLARLRRALSAAPELAAPGLAAYERQADAEAPLRRISPTKAGKRQGSPSRQAD
ncbi:hypothetical protein [Stella sp.]|uniref:hypothetical protein n=1 Tax=Stella sp. TaxID=2912054 RepID=UPI0035B4CB72